MNNEPVTPTATLQHEDDSFPNEVDMQETPQRISELTKELNKWRIKATLLVEKKNKTRNLKKENSKMKKEVQELRLQISSQADHEVTPTVSPGGASSSTIDRCPI